MADQLILDLVINGEGANTSISEMKKQIKELKSAMLNLDPNSEEFAKAAEKAGELADNIDDAGEAMNSMKGQGTLEGVNSSLGRMDEKMQNLDFDGLAKDISLMATSISNIKLSDFTKGLQSIGSALGKLGAAILTNPIFLLAATIAAVAGATYLLIKAVNEETDAERRNRLAREAVNDAMNEGKASAAESEIRLNALLAVVNDHTKAENERQAALDSMNGIMGTTLTLTDDLTVATQAYIDKLITQAQTDAIVKRMAEIKNQLADVKKLNEDAQVSTLDKVALGVNDLLGLRAWGSTEERKENARVATSVEDLNAQYTALEIQLKSLTPTTAANTDETKKAAEETRKAEKAIADAERAAEKLRLELERLTNEGRNWYDKLLYDNSSPIDKINTDFNKMWDAADLYYSKNIISFEEYNNAYKLINENFHKKIEEENNKHLAHTEATEEERLKENLDAAQNYFDELLKNENNDENSIKAILARKQQAFYDYYNGLLDLETKKADEDGIRTETELARIDALIAKRNEYTAVAVEGDKQTTESSEAARIQRLNDNISTLENYRAVNDTMGNISSSFFEFLGNLSEGNAKRQKKIAKVAFGVNKATSAVETAISTSQAIMKIAADTPTPFSIPLQILTGIQGAAQIAAILSKKFPENGDSGSVSNSSINAAATTATPSNQTLFSSGGGTPSNITPFANQQMTQKVYVLESDITSTQANVQKVQVQSVF